MGRGVEYWSDGVLEYGSNSYFVAHSIVHFVGSFLAEVLDKVKDKVDDKGLVAHGIDGHRARIHVAAASKSSTTTAERSWAPAVRSDSAP